MLGEHTGQPLLPRGGQNDVDGIVDGDDALQAVAVVDHGRGHQVILGDHAGGVFLAVVSLGIAIDVTVRGQGLVALWVFVGAYVVLVTHLAH